MVAGEVSGDLLGAGLIRALKKRLPDVRFEGVCGEHMEAEGCRNMFPMEWLSIIGLVEAVGKYPQIQWMRRDLVKHFLGDPPDLFVGIDVPDFNLGLERRLRAAGIGYTRSKKLSITCSHCSLSRPATTKSNPSR